MPKKIEMPPLFPTEDRVLLRRDPEDTQEKIGTLYVPTTAAKKNRATVLAVGPGKFVDGKLAPVRLEVGSRVVLPDHVPGAWVERDTDGADLIIIRASDVLAVEVAR